MIDITGYVTEARGNNAFTIKVTRDKATHLSFRDIQVSKEVEVFIKPSHYPNDYHTEFKFANKGGYGRKQVDKCISLSKVLKMGDQVKCTVFIVETKISNEQEVYAINNNPNDIETYTKFSLWLYPNDDHFQRLEVDSKESLKFRKQWRYTCINKEKYEKIDGYLLRDYWWINKNPTIIRPILWWIWIKTKASKLWERFTGRENSSAIGVIGCVATIVLGIIGIVLGIISIVVGIWF